MDSQNGPAHIARVTASAPSRSPARPRPRWLSPGRLALLLVLLLVVLAGGHTILWNTMSSRLQSGFDAWAAARRAQGWRIEHGTPTRGGWPLSATLRLPDFRLSGGGATVPGGLDWTARAVTLRVALPRLDTLHISAGGPQRLRLGTLDLPFAADRLAGRLPLQPYVLPRGGSFETSRLRIGTEAGGVEVGSATLEFDSRSTAIEGEAAIRLEGSARAIMLPSNGPLGRSIQEAALEANLTGPLPAGRSPTNRAEAWRDAGGTLEIRRLDLRWGPANAQAAATVALDDALQPMGAGTLKLAGAEAVVDALANAGLIPARSAALARRVVGMLARPPAEGEPPQLEVPLTLEDRSLSVARIPVARLPALTWPAGQAEGPGPGP
ncbi:DUF2125 domain-containing protein [Muricoccus radiodurans]|uniref:DUF2125 domain-containing protein n=1 Tax=Muricoccus radiodurans TaxID=2231721 RepID=UPI003CF0F0F0